MKNILPGIVLGLASIFPTVAPVEAAYNADIYLHNECHEDAYVEVKWFDQAAGLYKFWNGYVEAYSYAEFPDFYISGSDDFTIRARSENYRWDPNYVHTENYSGYSYTFYCN